MTLTHTIPTKYHIAGIKKIAVAPFSYEMTYHKKGSENIPKMLRRELGKNGFFKVAEKSSLKPLAMDEKYSIRRIAEAGRADGVDAVISGNVTGYQVEFSPCSGGQVAEVSFCIDLIDVRRGKRTDSQCYEGTGTRAIKIKLNDKKISNEDRVLLGTTLALAEKFVRFFTPHKVTEKISFDNAKPCKKGVRLARKNLWAEAVIKWSGVLEANDKNTCALYNLGLAKERDENYAEALEYYKKAADKRAVKRAERKIKEKEKLKQQL